MNTRTKSPESVSAESGLFCLYGARLEHLNSTVRWTVDRCRLDGSDTLILLPHREAKCKRVSPLGHFAQAKFSESRHLGRNPPVFSMKTGGFDIAKSQLCHQINKIPTITTGPGFSRLGLLCDGLPM